MTKKCIYFILRLLIQIVKYDKIKKLKEEICVTDHYIDLNNRSLYYWRNNFSDKRMMLRHINEYEKDIRKLEREKKQLVTELNHILLK